MKDISPTLKEMIGKGIRLHPAQKDLITRAGKSKVMSLSPRRSGKSTMNGLDLDMIIMDELSDVDPSSYKRLKGFVTGQFGLKVSDLTSHFDPEFGPIQEVLPKPPNWGTW